MLHRTRQLLVRQRTMISNALRGHLAEMRARCLSLSAATLSKFVMVLEPQKLSDDEQRRLHEELAKALMAVIDPSPLRLVIFADSVVSERTSTRWPDAISGALCA
jgi:hypothetical protein